MTALGEAEVPPSAVSCSEGHGTGVAFGGPIEDGALKATLGGQRPERQPLVMAAVKTNIGPSRALQGVAGLAKVAAMPPRRLAPPNLHFQEPPHVDLDIS